MNEDIRILQERVTDLEDQMTALATLLFKEPEYRDGYFVWTVESLPPWIFCQLLNPNNKGSLYYVSREAAMAALRKVVLREFPEV